MNIVIQVKSSGSDNCAKAIGRPIRANSTMSPDFAVAKCAAKVRHFPRKDVTVRDIEAKDLRVVHIGGSIWEASWPDPD